MDTDTRPTRMYSTNNHASCPMSIAAISTQLAWAGLADLPRGGRTRTDAITITIGASHEWQRDACMPCERDSEWNACDSKERRPVWRGVQRERGCDGREQLRAHGACRGGVLVVVGVQVCVRDSHSVEVSTRDEFGVSFLQLGLGERDSAGEECRLCRRMRECAEWCLLTLRSQ